MLLDPSDQDTADTLSGPTDATPRAGAADAPRSGTSGEQAGRHLILVDPDIDLEDADDGNDVALRTTTPAPEPAPLEVPPAGPSVGGVYVEVVKPLLDRAMAAALLLLTLPVLLGGMLAVRLSMGPGVFFRQRRVGKDGRLFTVYKLRTMGHDRRSTSAKDLEAYAAGRWDGVERRRTHKTEADPRHTDVGRLLRKLSVDELPQLVNVLRGEMSLVGPRPELPGVVERHYEPWMHRRHAVRPGVTGLWQISMRGEGDMHEHVDVDLDYVDTISFTEDLRILLLTPFAALGKQKGA